MRAIEKRTRPCWLQASWFLGLWLAGVVSVGLVAGLIKLGMRWLK